MPATFARRPEAFTGPRPTAGGGGDRSHAWCGKVLRDTYRVLRTLNEGGTSVVLESVHVRTQRRFAIKVLAARFASDPFALELFKREAGIVANVSHPNVVRVIDHDVADDGSPFLVMELLEGEGLDARLDRVRAMSLGEAVRIARGIASGLAAVHEGGVVHRDLKPGNVFLTRVPTEPGGVPRLIDFGISRHINPLASTTPRGVVLGTPEYMAPEQFSGSPSRIDHRTDQFALAVLTYEMLTGIQPFVADTITATLLRVSNDTPAPASTMIGGLPAGVDHVLARAMSKRQDDRYPSVVDFAAALSAEARDAGAQFTLLSRLPLDSAVRLRRIANDVESPTLEMTIPPIQTRRTTPARIHTPSMRGVLARLETARDAFASGALDTAAAEAEAVYALVSTSNDRSLQSVGRLAAPIFAPIFESYVGERDRSVRIASVLPPNAWLDLSPEAAFLASRLEPGMSVEDAIDASGMPTEDALRLLAGLLRRGLARLH